MIYNNETVTVLESGTLTSRIIRAGQEEWDAVWVKNSQLKEDKAPRTPRSLCIATLTDNLRPFVDYLRTPEANTTLELEARNADMDTAIRTQYAEISGEELTEGAGYRIAPDSASKRGSEGSVLFVPLSEYPAEVQDLLSPDGMGHINHIDFVWMLVEQGFRVRR